MGHAISGIEIDQTTSSRGPVAARGEGGWLQRQIRARRLALVADARSALARHMLDAGISFVYSVTGARAARGGAEAGGDVKKKAPRERGSSRW